MRFSHVIFLFETHELIEPADLFGMKRISWYATEWIAANQVISEIHSVSTDPKAEADGS